MRRIALILTLAACGTVETQPTNTSADSPTGETSFGSDEKAFTSAIATLLDFEFDASFVSASEPWNPRSAVQDYLLYTIGHLNEQSRGVGRLDAVTVTNIKNEKLADGTVKTSFHAKLPVAWSSKTSLPTSYTFKMPARGDWEGFDAFVNKYGHTCADWGAHDLSSGNFWYYYRPQQSGCQMAAEDFASFPVSITTSTENTTRKYPEYHKLWEDNQLSVIAIFGKYEDGATTASDAGIAAFNEMVNRAKSELGANVPQNPGVESPDVSFTLDLGNGKSVLFTALLVDNVANPPSWFDARYNALSANADLIAYNGHAGLGQNVRALVRKGTFVKGKYQIVFMNGCDTFAYVDGALAQKKAQLNPDDPKGTKYLDMITNAMPSYFHSNADNMIAIVKALKNTDAPSTYEQIFRSVDSQQIVVSTGEEDNEYFPGFGGGSQPQPWAGHKAKAAVQKNAEWRYETPLLQPGTYEFSITGSGDADLYTRAGEAPSLSTWDCRPYGGDANETCSVTVTAPIKVSVLVHGYSDSTFEFSASQR